MTPVDQCGLARPHEVLFPLILAVFAPWTVQCHRRPEKNGSPFWLPKYTHQTTGHLRNLNYLKTFSGTLR